MAVEGEGILQLPRKWQGEVRVMPDRRAEGSKAWAVSGEGAWRPGEAPAGQRPPRESRVRDKGNK